MFFTIKKIKYLLKGFGTYFPDWIPFPKHQWQFRGKGQRPYQGRKEVARIFYSSWMHIYARAKQEGVDLPLDYVGELGPGDSLAAGAASLLTGAKKYIALDIVPTAFNFNNSDIFEEMVSLFRNKTPIPVDILKHKPDLKSQEIPLSDDELEKNLSSERIERIGNSIKNLTDMVQFDGDWYSTKERPTFIFSTAVMEHVEDPKKAYALMHKILPEGGYMAHSIDYSSHHTAPGWDGHWTYSHLVWKVVQGKCKYFINRWTHEQHKNEIEKYFSIIIDESYPGTDPLNISYPYNIRQGFFLAKKNDT